MGWLHTHMLQWRIKRDISLAEVSPEEQGVPSLYQSPQPVAPVRGRGALQQCLAMKISMDSIHAGELEDWWKLRCSLKGHAYG